MTNAGEALAALKKKLLDFGSAAEGASENLLSLSAEEDLVGLAAGSAQKATYIFSGINGKWDPKDHPRDPNTGEFVKALTGFIFGKAKTGTFAVSGQAKKVDLHPGDVAFKTTNGNLVVSHPDGSYSLHHGTKIDKIPEGNLSLIAAKVQNGEYKKIAENPGTEVDAKDETEAAEKIAHPDQYGATASEVTLEPAPKPKSFTDEWEDTEEIEAPSDGGHKEVPAPPALKPGKTKFTAKQYKTYQDAAKGAFLQIGADGTAILSGDWVEGPDKKPYQVHASPFGKGKVTAYRWVSTKQQASNLEKEDVFSVEDLSSTTYIEDPTGKPYVPIGQEGAVPEGVPDKPKHGSLMKAAVTAAIPNTATAHKKHVADAFGKVIEFPHSEGVTKGATDANGNILKSGDWVEIDGKPVQVHSSPNEGNVAIAKWVSTKQQASNNTYDFPASVLDNAVFIEDPTGKPYQPLSEKLATVPDGWVAEYHTTGASGPVYTYKKINGTWTVTEPSSYAGLQVNEGSFAEKLEGLAYDPSEISDPEPVDAEVSEPSPDFNPDEPYTVDPFDEDSLNSLPVGSFALAEPFSFTANKVLLLKGEDGSWSIVNGDQKDEDGSWATAPASSAALILNANGASQTFSVLPPKSTEAQDALADPVNYPWTKKSLYDHEEYYFRKGAWYDAQGNGVASDVADYLDDQWDSNKSIVNQIEGMDPGDELHLTKKSTGKVSIYTAQEDGSLKGPTFAAPKPKSYFTDYLTDNPKTASHFEWKIMAAGESTEDVEPKQQQFVHPVSGVLFPLESGDKVYKHTSTDNGYIIVKGSGDNPINFFTQNGKQQKPKAHQKNLDKAYKEVDTWPGKVDLPEGAVAEDSPAAPTEASAELVEGAEFGAQVEITSKNGTYVWTLIAPNTWSSGWTTATTWDMAQSVKSKGYGSGWSAEFYPQGKDAPSAVAPGTEASYSLVKSAVPGDKIYTYSKLDDDKLQAVYTKQDSGSWTSDTGGIASESSFLPNSYVSHKFYPKGTSPDVPEDKSPWGSEDAAGAPQVDPEPVSTKPAPKKKGKQKEALPKTATLPDGKVIDLKPGEAFGKVKDTWGSEYYVHVTAGPKTSYSNTNHLYNIDGSPSYWDKASKWSPTSLKSWIKKNGGELLAENAATTEKIDFSQYEATAFESPDAYGRYNEIQNYIYAARKAFPITTNAYGSIYPYASYEQFDGKPWGALDVQQKVSLIADYEQIAGKAVASLEPVAKMDSELLGKSDKQDFGKARTGFTLVHRTAVIARELQNPDTEWDDDRFASEIAYIASKVAKPGVSLSHWLKGRFPIGDLYNTLNSANKQRQFKNSLTALDFDPYNGTTEEYDSYAKSKGFLYLAALSEDDQKQWVLADLGDPTLSASTKASVEKAADAAKSKVVIASLAADLQKSHGKIPTPTNVTKGVFLKTALKAEYSWESEGGAKASVKNIGHDEWEMTTTTPSGVDSVISVNDAVAFIVVNGAVEGGSSVIESDEPAYGDVSPESNYAKLKQKHGFTPNSGIGKLHSVISLEGGGPGTAALNAEDSIRWLWYHAAGDEIAKYQMERKANGGFHPNADSHPGSPTLPSGAAAYKALVEHLSLIPEGQKYVAGGSLNGAERSALSAHLGITNDWVADGSIYDSYATWRAYHPQEELTPFAGSFGVSTVGGKATKPSNVPDASWDLVNSVEGSTDLSTLFPDDGLGALSEAELDTSLTGNTAASNAGLIAPILGAIPVHLKRLALWGAQGDEGDEYRRGVLHSVAAKAKAGEFLTDDTPAWVSPSGDKYPISPGASVYKHEDYSNTYYYVSGPPNADGTPSSTGWKFTSGSPVPVKASAHYMNSLASGALGSLVFTMPGQVKWDQAKKDNPDLHETFWDESSLIEQGLSTKYAHYESGALLTAALKNNLTLEQNYPNLYAQHKSLPENVRQAVLSALEKDHKPMLDVLEYKASKKHYASMTTKGLFDAAQPWLPHLSKGQTSEEAVNNEWSAAAKQAYSAYFSVPAGGIASHLNSLLNPETVQVTKALPAFSDLKLTKTNKTLGGMHTKHVWVDQDGNEWMSKAFNSDPNAKARVDAETGAVRIGQLFGFRVPAANTQAVPGYDYAYLQHLAPSTGDFTGKGPKDVSVKQLQQAMEEHLLDWITSNHDTHPQNLLIDPNGNVFGIDKGQAFKHFPNDKLAVGYLPPENGAAVWYDQFYKGVQSGQIDKETADAVTKHVLRRAQKISKDRDDDYRAELETALQNRTFWPSEYPSREQFIDGLVERKHNLFNDFVDFYKSVYAKAPYDFDIDTENLVPPKLDDHTHIAVSSEFAADVAKAGIHGKALFFNSEDLRDSHVMFSQVLGPDKKPMLTGEARIREAHDKKIMDWLKKQTITNQSSAQAQSYNDYDTTPHNTIDPAHLPGNTEWFAAMVGGSKTVSHHNAANDGHAYNMSTLAQMESAYEQILAAKKQLAAWNKDNPGDPYKGTVPGASHHSALDVELQTSEQQEQWESMMDTYIGYYEKVIAAKGTDNKIKPHFTQHVYTPSKTALDIIKAKQATDKPANLFMPSKISEILEKAKNGDEIVAIHPNVSGGTPVVYVKEYGGWKSGALTTSSADMEQTVKNATANDGWTFTYSGTIPGVPDKDTIKSWANQQEVGAVVTMVKPDGSKVSYVKASEMKWHDQNDDWVSGGGFADYLKKDWKVLDAQTAEDALYASSTVKVGSKVLKVTYRKAASKAGTLNKDGDLEMSNSEIQNFDFGNMYEIDFGNTVIEYRPFDPNAGVAKAQRGLLKFRKTDWSSDDTTSIDEVLDVLRHMGLDLDPADEASMELFYWRHVTGTVRDRKEGKSKTGLGAIVKEVDDARKKKPDMSVTEELQAHKAAWEKVIGKEKVDNARWLPQFSRNRVHVLDDHDDDFTSGKPYWLRPDVTAAELKKYHGNTYIASSLYHPGDALKIVKSGAALSSEERYRVLASGFQSGWSSEADAQSHGSSGVIYTRQHMALNWGSGYSEHVYYHPKVALRASNYAYDSDHYGDYDSRTSTPFKPDELFTMKSGGNEFLIRHSLSVLDDIAFLHFSNAKDRDEAIKYYKDRGITQIHGFPIEDVFVMDRSAGKKIVDKLWADLLAEEN